MKPKVNYTYYDNFGIITESECIREKKDVIFRIDGNITFDNLQYNRCVFNNKGNVTLTLSKKEPRTLIFDNDGDVELYLYIEITSCAISFFNRGRVVIHGKAEKIYYTKSDIKVYNEGDVEFHSIDTLHRNWKLRNEGNVSLLNVNKIDRNFSFGNCGYVNIEHTSKILDKVSFENKGYVSVVSDKIEIDESCEFRNGGDVVINTNHSPFAPNLIKFLNKGNVEIFAGSRMNGMGISAKNGGNFTLNGITEITTYSKTEIESRGNVVMNDIVVFDAPIVFRNGGDVRMPNLTSLPHPKYVEFRNGGNLLLKKLDLDDINTCPVLKCSGNTWVKSISIKDLGKRINYKGIIYTESDTYYNNTTSYVKRNNITLRNGYMILYKGVGRKGIASYDECSDKWETGIENTVCYWDPYTNEIGKGKYVASYDTKIFKKLLYGEKVKYYAIEVHIDDIFEFPFGKYPQLIGIRKAKVLYEVDENKNKIEI